MAADGLSFCSFNLAREKLSDHPISAGLLKSSFNYCSDSRRAWNDSRLAVAVSKTQRCPCSGILRWNVIRHNCWHTLANILCTAVPSPQASICLSNIKRNLFCQLDVYILKACGEIIIPRRAALPQRCAKTLITSGVPQSYRSIILLRRTNRYLLWFLMSEV